MGEQRTDAFEYELLKHGLRNTRLYGDREPGASRNLFGENSARMLGSQLSKLSHPLAIYCPNDERATAVLEACELFDLPVPDRIAVLGTDNIQLICDYTYLPLSSVDTDLFRLGYEAAKLLQHLMDGGAPPQHPVLIPAKEVVSRKSTDLLAADSIEVSRTLRTIWEQYADPLLDVPRLVAGTTISRRQLETLFHKEIGRTLNEEINRIRLKHVCRLLKESDLRISQIAEATGYGSQQYLFRRFRNTFGTTPLQFRMASRREDAHST